MKNIVKRLAAIYLAGATTVSAVSAVYCASVIDEARNNAEVSYSEQTPEVPSYVKQALVSSQDKNFYEHGGVDWLAPAQATIRYLKDGRFHKRTTLTEMAANSVIPHKQNHRATGKLESFGRALKLEEVLEKDQILGIVLDNMPVRGNRKGIEFAWDYHFGEDIGDYVVGIPTPDDFVSVMMGQYDSEEQATQIYRNFIGRADLRNVGEIVTTDGKNTIQKIKDLADGKVNTDVVDFLLRSCYEGSAIMKSPFGNDLVIHRDDEKAEKRVKFSIGYCLGRLHQDGKISDVVKSSADIRLQEVDFKQLVPGRNEI